MKLKFSILCVIRTTWCSYSVADCACWSRPGLYPKGLFLSESMVVPGRHWENRASAIECNTVLVCVSGRATSLYSIGYIIAYAKQKCTLIIIAKYNNVYIYIYR